jgi:tRNA(adenine34) deaminase
MAKMFSDEYFMNEALKQAQIAFEEREIPVGAVVVAGNKIIARAYNQTEKLQDPTAHAEMLAITSATACLSAKYLPDCRIYVTLEPCVMCAGALFWSQIGQLIYGCTDDSRGYHSISPSALHPKTLVKKGVFHKECGELITRFFSQIRDRD